jgi:hypothetical protein
MHVIPAEILNGHNKIFIDNIASELIVNSHSNSICACKIKKGKITIMQPIQGLHRFHPL